VYGFSGGCTVIIYAVAREHNRREAAGTTMGVVNMTTMGVSALFQPLLGWLLDLTWDGTMEGGARLYSVEDYHAAFLSFTVCAVIAIGAATLIRETGCVPLEDRSGTPDQRE
jgi:MFS family permease